MAEEHDSWLRGIGVDVEGVMGGLEGGGGNRVPKLEGGSIGAAANAAAGAVSTAGGGMTASVINEGSSSSWTGGSPSAGRGAGAGASGGAGAVGGGVGAAAAAAAAAAGTSNNGEDVAAKLAAGDNRRGRPGNLAESPGNAYVNSGSQSAGASGSSGDNGLAKGAVNAFALSDEAQEEILRRTGSPPVAGAVGGGVGAAAAAATAAAGTSNWGEDIAAKLAAGDNRRGRPGNLAESPGNAYVGGRPQGGCSGRAAPSSGPSGLPPAPPSGGGAGLAIQGSVGRGGRNGPADVHAVQNALNQRTNAGLVVDGLCGPKTIGAISSFQASLQQSEPDGLVEPGKATARALAGQSG